MSGYGIPFSAESALDKARDQAQSTMATAQEKASETAAAVQRASADAYETVKQTVEERPVLMGLLAAAAIGFAVGAVWKLGSRR